MRSTCRSALLALVAVVALSAVVAASASAALPEFKPSTKQAFTSKMAGDPYIERGGYEKPLGECTGGKTVGEIVNATQVGKVVVTLTGCGSEIGNCNTSGKSSGEVVFNALKGELGVSGKTAVLGLEPEKAGGVVAEIYCGPYLRTVKGGLIGEITPIEQLTTTFKQVWEQSDSRQKYRSFEGSSTKKTRSLHLEMAIRGGGEFLESGLEAFAEPLTFEKEVEIT
jgi:hypothetical protein